MDSSRPPGAAVEASQLQIQTTGIEFQVKYEHVDSVLVEVKIEPDQESSSAGRKRKGRELKNEDESPPQRRTPAKKVKKMDEGEADTSILRPLPDHLKHGLDVVFCGINAGRMSAETGHHYANPTNHFWRCLHRSGMTTTFVPATEDFSLPESFNFGLTNLVGRASTQARELSKAEMTDSVSTLLEKIARYRPRFVCFVGMVLWDVVRNGLLELLQQDIVDRTKKVKTKVGLQSYKLVYSKTKGDLPGSQETFFFVLPSTSGRVVQYQLSDKITLFKKLHTLVNMPSSEVDTEGMQSIAWDA